MKRFGGGKQVLFFIANDGAHGDELWRSDGTASGTVLVKDIGPGNSVTGWLTRGVGHSLLFSARTPALGEELWQSDGTPAGTRLVKDLYELQALKIHDPGSVTLPTRTTKSPFLEITLNFEDSEGNISWSEESYFSVGTAETNEAVAVESGIDMALPMSTVVVLLPIT